MSLVTGAGIVIGELIDRRMRGLGLNQTSLSALTSGELRQNYISQVVQGKVQVPLGRKADLFREHLHIGREEWYRAAGMLDDVGVNDPPPRQLALLSLTGEEEYDADALVAYVESRPGRIFQQQLAEARRERNYDEYVEFCLSIFRAWESNSNLGIKALALGRSTGTGGL